MSSQEKRNQIYAEFKKLIPLCINGNVSAKEFLEDLNHVVRTIDDIVDKDENVSITQIQYTFFVMCFKLQVNPFYLQNCGILTGVLMVAYNAWIDSDKLKESEDKIKNKWGSVIRGYIDEILPVTAYLTGGYTAMREVSIKLRDLEVLYRGDRP